MIGIGGPYQVSIASDELKNEVVRKAADIRPEIRPEYVSVKSDFKKYDYNNCMPSYFCYARNWRDAGFKLMVSMPRLWCFDGVNRVPVKTREQVKQAHEDMQRLGGYDPDTVDAWMLNEAWGSHNKEEIVDLIEWWREELAGKPYIHNPTASSSGWDLPEVEKLGYTLHIYFWHMRADPENWNAHLRLAKSIEHFKSLPWPKWIDECHILNLKGPENNAWDDEDYHDHALLWQQAITLRMAEYLTGCFCVHDFFGSLNRNIIQVVDGKLVEHPYYSHYLAQGKNWGMMEAFLDGMRRPGQEIESLKQEVEELKLKLAAYEPLP